MVCFCLSQLLLIANFETGLDGDRYRGLAEGSVRYASSRHSTGRKSSFLAASNYSASVLRAASSHAPSFHSAVETMASDTNMVSPVDNRRTPLSPTATTPGSQSPRRPTTLRSRRESSDGQFTIGKSRSRVLLSSSFAKPQFKLDAIEPDLRNVPELVIDSKYGGDNGIEDSWASVETFIDESTAQTSVVVDFVSGVRGYCTAVAAKAVIQLLESLQPKVRFITDYHSRIFWSADSKE